MGAAKGLALSGSPIVALGSRHDDGDAWGYIARICCSGEPSVPMRPEIYCRRALAGAGGLCCRKPGRRAAGCGVSRGRHSGLCRARVGAIRYGWAFSPLQARPGRPPGKRRDVDQAETCLVCGASLSEKLRGRGPICWITRPAARTGPSLPQSRAVCPGHSHAGSQQIEVGRRLWCRQLHPRPAPRHPTRSAARKDQRSEFGASDDRNPAILGQLPRRVLEIIVS